MKGFYRALRRRLARTGAIAGVGMLVLAGISMGTGLTAQPQLVLTGGADFTIKSTITAAGCTGGAALLEPGVTRCFTYTVYNPLSATIYVSSLSIASVKDPAGCPDSTNLDYSHTTFTGSLSVPAGGSASTPANSLSITMRDTKVSQNACQGGAFNFTYSGSATYTEVFPTTTTLSSSPNPSSIGQQVAYTATVSATGTPPSPPTGSVTFYDGSTPITCAVGSHAFNGATATCLVTYTSPSTHLIKAAFTNTDGNFGASTSNTVTQQVGQIIGACLGSTLSGAVITGTYNGNYEVKNGTSLWLNGGTITGNVTVDITGQFAATNGSISGNLVSQGGPVSITGTHVYGNLQASGASVGVGPGSKLDGNFVATAGGPVCVNGTSANPVQILAISGNSQIVQLAKSTTQSTLCGTVISGNLVVQNDGGPIAIGGSSSCAGNTISGNISVVGNSGAVSVGGAGAGLGNTARGNISVQSNTGGGSLTHDSAGGNCVLQGDSPGIVGSSNTASGGNTCNRTA